MESCPSNSLCQDTSHIGDRPHSDQPADTGVTADTADNMHDGCSGGELGESPGKSPQRRTRGYTGTYDEEPAENVSQESLNEEGVSTPSQEKNPWDRLAAETQLKIFSYLDQLQLGRIATVCKSFCRRSRDPILWRELAVWH